MQGSLWADAQKSDEASKYMTVHNYLWFLYRFARQKAHVFIVILSMLGLQSLICLNLRVFSQQQCQIQWAHLESQVGVPPDQNLTKFIW